jgi:hypothetical protein
MESSSFFIDPSKGPTTYRVFQQEDAVENEVIEVEVLLSVPQFFIAAR